MFGEVLLNNPAHVSEPPGHRDDIVILLLLGSEVPALGGDEEPHRFLHAGLGVGEIGLHTL
eukprot:3104254-Alexandrium_andersonii.AAC.1